MTLEGGCYCGKVSYSVEAAAPYPYQRCYCSICRMTAGGGGYSINLGAAFETLKVSGGEHVKVFQAPRHKTEGGENAPEGELSTARRAFCGACGTYLWVYSPEWPDLVHPFAGSVRTPLPVPPEIAHIMLDYKAPWIEVPEGEGHVHFGRYADESLEEWHRRHGLWQGD